MAFAQTCSLVYTLFLCCFNQFLSQNIRVSANSYAASFTFVCHGINFSLGSLPHTIACLRTYSRCFSSISCTSMIYYGKTDYFINVHTCFKGT